MRVSGFFEDKGRAARCSAILEQGPAVRPVFEESRRHGVKGPGDVGGRKIRRIAGLARLHRDRARPGKGELIPADRGWSAQDRVGDGQARGSTAT